jgi:TolB-like protein/DNA-binding winged helix-turn-helix (wHTH) protein/Tfp pilus assembly protein PilF
MQQPPVYGFGDWQLDAGQRLLFRSGTLVPLPPKVLEILLVLVERHGRIVEKEELLSRVWPDVIVEEGNVLRNVSTLRKTLDSDYIETIPRRGYRFVAPVTVIADRAAVTEEVPSRPGDSPDSSASLPPGETPVGRSMRAPALVVAAALVLLAALGWHRWHAATREPTRLAFVVLPFQNLTGDAAREYLVDGLTEEVITQLAGQHPDGLGVIARTSAMAYKAAPKGIAEIGRELGVDHVLEGSVRQEGERLRITVQLIRVKDEMHLWAHSYQRDLGGVITLQDEIARDIATQIRGRLQQPTPRVRERTVSAAAYDAYLRGRFHWNTRTPDGLRKGLAHFEEALEKDPEFALAHAGVADSYGLLANFQVLSPREAFPRAIESAQRAIALDETLADAHASLAFARFHYDYDWPGAEQSFRRAIALNPSHARAHLWFAAFLSAMGRHGEAREENRLAQQLDPLSLVPRINAGRLFLHSGDYQNTLDEMRRALDLDPDQAWAHLYSAMAHAELGQHGEAAQAALQARPITFGQPGALDAYCAARSGRDVDARNLLARLKEERSASNLDPTLLAGVHAALGERAQALELLDVARVEHAPLLAFAGVFPWLAPLRGEPRFRALLRDLALPDVGAPRP